MFKKPLHDIVHPYVNDIRSLLSEENEKFKVCFENLDWRMGMVVATRARNNIMVPKYTLKFDLKDGESQETSSVVMDSDYNNLKRL